jgi:hypothetical protein
MQYHALSLSHGSGWSHEHRGKETDVEMQCTVQSAPQQWLPEGNLLALLTYLLAWLGYNPSTPPLNG